MDAVHVAERERMDLRIGINKFREDLRKVFVALDAELIFSEVEICHHVFHGNRKSSPAGLPDRSD